MRVAASQRTSRKTLSEASAPLPSHRSVPHGVLPINIGPKTVRFVVFERRHTTAATTMWRARHIPACDLGGRLAFDTAAYSWVTDIETMTITDELDETIDGFLQTNENRLPTLIKLGRRQVAILKAFASEYSDSRPIDASQPNYNGIRIQEEDVESHLSIE
jgi:hypothetical protein